VGGRGWNNRRTRDILGLGRVGEAVSLLGFWWVEGCALVLDIGDEAVLVVEGFEDW